MVVAFCVRVRACASATQPMVAVAAAAAPPSEGLLSNLLGEFPVFRPGHSLSLLSSGRTMEQQGNFIPGVKIWSNLSYPLQGEDLYVKHWWEPISGASKQF